MNCIQRGKWEAISCKGVVRFVHFFLQLTNPSSSIPEGKNLYLVLGSERLLQLGRATKWNSIVHPRCLHICYFADKSACLLQTLMLT